MVDPTPRPPFDDPCVVFKPLTTDGGLERYVSALARAIDAPLYTARQTVAPDHFEGVEVRTFEHRTRSERALQRLSLGSLVEQLAYENFPVPPEHDAVVTVGEQAKGVVHRPRQHRIHLLNMPPRWLFDRGPGRFDDAIGPLRVVRRAYQSFLRSVDVTATARIDEFVVPSETIGRRLETYYDRRAAHVVYPPVRVDSFRSERGDGYLLYVGRLAPAKGVREIVATISETDRRLVVAGTGPLADELERLAGENVDLLGYVDERRKRDLLARCDGLVFNSDDEAFGIVPVEALASGKPVVAVNDGYTRYQIEHGVNGLLFEPGHLEEAVRELYRREWDPETIQETARRYDVESFRAAWRGLVRSPRDESDQCGE